MLKRWRRYFLFGGERFVSMALCTSSTSKLVGRFPYPFQIGIVLMELLISYVKLENIYEIKNS